jgi:hypothetical protein
MGGEDADGALERAMSAAREVGRDGAHAGSAASDVKSNIGADE